MSQKYNNNKFGFYCIKGHSIPINLGIEPIAVDFSFRIYLSDYNNNNNNWSTKRLWEVVTAGFVIESKL